MFTFTILHCKEWISWLRLRVVYLLCVKAYMVRRHFDAMSIYYNRNTVLCLSQWLHQAWVLDLAYYSMLQIQSGSQRDCCKGKHLEWPVIDVFILCEKKCCSVASQCVFNKTTLCSSAESLKLKSICYLLHNNAQVNECPLLIPPQSIFDKNFIHSVLEIQSIFKFYF